MIHALCTLFLDASVPIHSIAQPFCHDHSACTGVHAILLTSDGALPMCRQAMRQRLRASRRPEAHLQSKPGISLPLALQVGSSPVGVERSSVRQEV